MTVSEVAEQSQPPQQPAQQQVHTEQEQSRTAEEQMSNEQPNTSDHESDPRLEDGKRLLATRKYSDAVDLFGQLAKDLTTRHESDPLHPELAPVWFLYGQALYQLATSQAPLLGSSVAEEVPVAIDENALVDGKHFVFEGEPEGAADEATGENKADAEDEVNGSSDAEGLADEEDDEDADDDEGGDDEDDEEGDASTDFQAAWEALETARLIYSKLPERRMELAEVYLALGDLSLEEERFDQAASDYKDGLVIKQGLLNNDNRELAEIHYKLALALEYQGQNDAALTEMENALGILRWRLNSLKDLSASTGGAAVMPVDPKGKGKAAAIGSIGSKPMSAEEIEEERKDLEMLLPDIQAKIEELRSSSITGTADSIADVAPSAASVFSGSIIRGTPVAPVSLAAATPVVNDLNMLVKKKTKPAAVVPSDPVDQAVPASIESVPVSLKRPADEAEEAGGDTKVAKLDE